MQFYLHCQLILNQTAEKPVCAAQIPQFQGRKTIWFNSVLSHLKLVPNQSNYTWWLNKLNTSMVVAVAAPNSSSCLLKGANMTAAFPVSPESWSTAVRTWLSQKGWGGNAFIPTSYQCYVAGSALPTPSCADMDRQPLQHLDKLIEKLQKNYNYSSKLEVIYQAEKLAVFSSPRTVFRTGWNEQHRCRSVLA